MSAELETNKEPAAQALARGLSVARTSRRTGVQVSTIRNWMGDTTFRERVREIQKEIAGQIRGTTTATALEAIKELRGIINDPETPARTKVTACKVVLDQLLGEKKSAELEEISARLDEIESR